MTEPNLYAFNILLEAKMRAMVVMTHKYHPDYSVEQIREMLKNTVDYAIEKERVGVAPKQ